MSAFLGFNSLNLKMHRVQTSSSFNPHERILKSTANFSNPSYLNTQKNLDSYRTQAESDNEDYRRTEDLSVPD